MAEEKKETEIVKVENNKLVADTNNTVYQDSDTWAMSCKMAKAMASSTLVPAPFQKNEANCMLAVSQSQKIGIDPITVANNLYLIQGKMSWKSEFVIALINNSKKFDMELQYEEEEKDGKPYSCKCWTTKDGRRVDGIKITMDMANLEGWTKKNGTKWNTLPQVMLRYRAASFFARFAAPELVAGMYTTEEYEDNDFDSNNSQNTKKATLNSLLKDDDTDVVEIVEIADEV